MPSLISLLVIVGVVMGAVITITLLVFAALIRSSQLSQAQELINGSCLEPGYSADRKPTQGPAPRSAPRLAHTRAAYLPKG